MVIDTSALLVLLGNEAEAERFREALAADSVRLVSAATVLEATLVVESRWGDAESPCSSRGPTSPAPTSPWRVRSSSAERDS